MAPEILAVAVERLMGTAPVSPSPDTARALSAAGLEAEHATLADLPDGAVPALVLLDDELGRAGEHADGLLARATQLITGGGLILASARGAVHAAATQAGGPGRRFTARELERALGHHGFVVELLCAPGAARALAGAPPAYDPELDRLPGLLDAAPTIVALGRRYPDAAARSAAFFSSLPCKVVAAATLCRDAADRLLVVHDSFKGHWTIPGGVVDADEDPRVGAERETWEEAGLRVRAGRLLGVFAGSWPDRLVMVYDAEPLGDTAAPLTPRHGHEIDAVTWMALDDAFARLDPAVAEQVRRCLTEPGGSWRRD